MAINSNIPDVDVTTKGVFGEEISAHKTPVVQISNKYRIDPANLTERLEIYEGTGGTADNNGNQYRCQSGVSVGGYGVVRSKPTLNYHAGQGVECMITASFTAGVASSLQFAGMFSLTETLAFGYDGANFSCLHSYNGAAEVQAIRVTVAASAAANCTVTLDGDALAIALTIATAETNAEQIRAALAADATLSGKWRFEQIDDTVLCISKTVGDKSGTMSFAAGGTGATATLTERTAGVAKTDNHKAQASWDYAPFSGFDPTKMNIYKIEFGYLGALGAQYSIFNPNTAKFQKVYTMKWANANTVAFLGSPNFKVGWTSASLGSSGSNLTVQGASAVLQVQGDEVIKNDTHAAVYTKASVSTTLTNILTIKNRAVFGDRYNLGKVRLIKALVENEHNKGLVVEVLRNATVAGTPNFQYHDEFNSIVAVDSAGTTVTGGELIDVLPVATYGSATLDLDVLKTQLFPEETLTFAARTVSGIAANTTVSTTWGEEK